MAGEWQTMDTAVITGPVTWVMVRLKNGSEVKAHFACDLSGEEQPPFRGWFKRVGEGHNAWNMEVLPVAWRPLREGE